MVKYHKFSVDTLTALAAAINVYRNQNNQVVRWNGDKPGNKELIYEHLSTNQEINPDLLIEAEKIRSALNQRVMLNTLVGARNNDFLVSVNQLLNQDKITSNNFGSLAWAPKLFDDAIKSDEVREQLLSYSAHSQFIEKPGKKITVAFQLISCRYIQNYDSFIHNGHDGQGNLIRFFNKKKIDNGMPIVGRVRSHQKDRELGNACTTILNYVKVVE